MVCTHVHVHVYMYIGTHCGYCFVYLAGAPIPPADPRALSSGDYVRVELELEVFQIMQQGHGGWNPSMATVSGLSVPYVYMYMHVHVLCCTSDSHMHVHACMHTHIRTHACTHTHTHTCAHMHTHIYMHAHTHMHTHAHTRAHTHTHIHTHTHTRTHAHAHVHEHTHTHIHTHRCMSCITYTTYVYMHGNHSGGPWTAVYMFCVLSLQLKDKLGVVHSTAETDPGIIKVRYGSDIWKVNQDAVVKASVCTCINTALHP